MEDMLSFDWNAECSKHEGDVQAQRDIFIIQIREAVERCIPKKVSERTNKYPVPLNDFTAPPLLWTVSPLDACAQSQNNVQDRAGTRGRKA